MMTTPFGPADGMRGGVMGWLAAKLLMISIAFLLVAESILGTI